jgi:UDP-N-acetylglucosamine 2-epimerase (non-hydrolysing)
MIDTLLRFRAKAERSGVLARLGLDAGCYAVATLHRPSNVDHAGPLRGLLDALREISRRLPVVFPVHPRTAQSLATTGLDLGGIRVVAPLGYLDFLRLMSCARLVLTDSGGIQEETTVLGVPCLTLRNNTERPATIEQGTNRLVGTERRRIVEAVEELLSSGPPPGRAPELWDGKASSRILNVLVNSRRPASRR